MNDSWIYIIWFAVFVASVFVSSCSQILLKKSANKKHSSGIREYLNPLVIVAYGLFFLSTVITVVAYKYVPASVGPILECFGYIFVTVLGYIFLKEKITKKMIIGMGLIFVGIAVITVGSNLSL